jgi:hypothetical protein
MPELEKIAPDVLVPVTAVPEYHKLPLVPVAPVGPCGPVPPVAPVAPYGP